MQTKVLQQNLTKALSIASRFSSTRAQLPILSNLLLKAGKTKLTVISTNLEISTSIAVGAKTEKEGEITVPGRVISEIVANLPPGEVSLEVEKEQLKIKSEKFSAMVLGMNAADFPPVPQTVDAKNALSLSLEELGSALLPVSFAASIDETRPTLTGVLFIFEGKELTLVATDGFRLSQNKILLPRTQKTQKIILPKSTLLEVLRLSGEGDLTFSFNQSERQVVFAVGETVLSSRVIEGDFPNFEKIIPKGSLSKIELDTEEFLRGVKLCSVFARGSANIVKATVKKSGLVLSAEASSAGSQEIQIEASVTGEPVEIAFNYRFLEEFLQSVRGETVTISLSGAASPAVFTEPGKTNLLHLIMPVRLQG